MNRALASWLCTLALGGCFTAADPATAPDAGGAAVTCPACERDCSWKECGDDGCGGTCGACSNGLICLVNQCVEPDPERCLARDCGADGRGGSCGDCPSGWSCSADGYCLPLGGCDAVPLGGTCVNGNAVRCEAGALLHVTCPYHACRLGPSGAAECVPAPCHPNCFGRSCGRDGCGGRCGACAAGESCDEDLGICVPPCQSLPSRGTCRGTVALRCAAGVVQKEACLATGRLCDDTTCSGAICLPPKGALPCIGLSDTGRCEAGRFFRCWEGAIIHQDCEASGLRCALAATDRYGCIP